MSWDVKPDATPDNVYSVDGLPSLPNAITLLRRAQPEALAAIEAEAGEEHRDVLETKFGPTPGTSLEKAELKRKIERDSLSAALTLCDQALGKIRKKLLRAAAFQRWAQIITAITSASFLGALAAKLTWLAYGLGILTLISSIFSILAQATVGTLDQSEHGAKLGELYANLVEARFSASTLIRDMDALGSLADEDLSELRTLLTAADEVARVVNKSVYESGVTLVEPAILAS